MQSTKYKNTKDAEKNDAVILQTVSRDSSLWVLATQGWWEPCWQNKLPWRSNHNSRSHLVCPYNHDDWWARLWVYTYKFCAVLIIINQMPIVLRCQVLGALQVYGLSKLYFCRLCQVALLRMRRLFSLLTKAPITGRGMIREENSRRCTV